jgi:ATP-binding cassette subfamily C protein LapB
MSEPTQTKTTRSPEIAYNFVRRFLKSASKSDIFEALNASTAEEPIGWTIDTLNHMGFICQLGKSTLSEISSELLPVILKGHDGSLMLLDQINEKNAKIFDASYGQLKFRKIKIEMLTEWYSGEVLIASPAKEDKKTLKSRLRTLNPIRALGSNGLFWVAMAAFISNVLGLSTSLFIMVVYDRVLPNQATESLYTLAVGVALAILFDTLLKGARSRIVERSTNRSDVSVTENIFEQYVEGENISGHRSTGQLATILRDFETFRDFMSSAIILALVDLPFVFIFVYVIYLIGGPLFIVPLIAIPTILIAVAAVQPILAFTSKRVASASQARQGIILEMLNGLEAIKANGAFAFVKRRFVAQSNQYAQATNKSKRYNQFNGNVIQIVQQIAQVAIIVYGFHLFIDQIITMGAIIAVVILSGRTLAPLSKVAQTLGRANAAYVAYCNLKGFLSAPRIASAEENDSLNISTGKEIELSNITLRLSEGASPLFNGLNLVINRGEKVAIIGKTGSGKTSLIKLILGLLRPETGVALIVGTDVRQLSRSELYRRVGTVFQEPWIFNGTLRENVNLGHDEFDDADVVRCLKLAGANFVGEENSEDLDVLLHDRGTNLSGGQKQAVMLARALLFSPKIYLFDEPTSSMDIEMENLVMQNLLNYLTEQTMILVTHKPNLVNLCDRVLILDRGRIAADLTKESYFEALKKGAQNNAR